MQTSSVDPHFEKSDLLEDLHKLTNGMKISSDGEGASKFLHDLDTQDALDNIANLRSKALVTYFMDNMAPSRNMFLSWATAEWVDKRGLDVEHTRYRGNNCFITTFKTTVGRDSALKSRPPRIKKSSPLLFAWCPEAEDPDFALIMKPVWVDLPAVHSIWQPFLGRMFQAMGPIVQFPISSQELHYPDARCRILWNVTKVPPDCIELWVGDIRVRIQVMFNKFQEIYLRCYQKGHSKKACGRFKQEAQTGETPTHASDPNSVPSGNNHRSPEAAQTGKTPPQDYEPNNIPSGKKQRRPEDAQTSKPPTPAWEHNGSSSGKNQRGPEAAQTGKTHAWEPNGKPSEKNKRRPEVNQTGKIPTPATGSNTVPLGKKQRGWMEVQSGDTQKHYSEAKNVPAGTNKRVPDNKKGVLPTPSVVNNQLKSRAQPPTAKVQEDKLRSVLDHLSGLSLNGNPLVQQRRTGTST